MKILKMSDKTIARSLEKGVEYNGFFYKKLGAKVKAAPDDTP